MSFGKNALTKDKISCEMVALKDDKQRRDKLAIERTAQEEGLAEKKLGVALIGCGKISHKYVTLLSQGEIPNAVLVSVCDKDGHRAKEYGKKYNVPHYCDYRQMFEKEGDNIAITAILTPSGHHAKCVKDIAPYGKHLIIEKPMALTLSDTDSMIQACDLAGIKIFIVKQNRYNVPCKNCARP